MNSTAIATVHTSSVISAPQIELLKRTICKGATEDELRIFLWQWSADWFRSTRKTNLCC